MANASPPLLTFGFERSGTTLLSMMLGSHPELAVPFSPTGLWYRYGRSLAAYDDLSTPRSLDRLIDDILAEERIRLWDVALDKTDIRADLRPGDFGTVVRRFHEAYAMGTGKPRWALHDIATLFDMDLAYRWFPNGRFLHLVRDARDVAVSHMGYEYGSGNVCETACRWKEAVHSNVKMGAMLAPEQYLVVRYEDLIRQPEATLARICGFAGLGYDPAMLDYEETVAAKVPSERRRLWPALGGKLDTAKLAQWGRLAPRKVAAIEEVAGDMLTDLGYERDVRAASNLGTELFLLYCTFNRGDRVRRLKRRLHLARRSTGD